MTNWYAYRWVCDKCLAFHYYEVTICQRCGCKQIKRKVNNSRLVELNKERKLTAPLVKLEPQDLKDSPVEDDDDELGTSGETTVQLPEDSNADFDDMINDILQG
jgi:hypothetical protein